MMVSVNAPALDRESILSQAVSHIFLINVRASTKYDILLHQLNKFPFAKSAVKLKMNAFDRLDSSPLFSFAAIKMFAADDTLLNLTAASPSSLYAAAQITLRETVSIVNIYVIVHPKQLSESFHTLPRP
jgi:hypothetical protein